jgi:hypothetical protein
MNTADTSIINEDANRTNMHQTHMKSLIPDSAPQICTEPLPPQNISAFLLKISSLARKIELFHEKFWKMNFPMFLSMVLSYLVGFPLPTRLVNFLTPTAPYILFSIPLVQLSLRTSFTSYSRFHFHTSANTEIIIIKLQYSTTCLILTSIMLTPILHKLREF